jgi:hypothetical protein
MGNYRVVQQFGVFYIQKRVVSELVHRHNNWFKRAFYKKQKPKKIIG